MAVVAAVATLATSADAAGTNLLANGTFEGSGSGSLAGWKGQNASLSLVAGDGGGFGAKVTRTASGSTYSILASAKPVKSTTAGATYKADGRFKAAAGKSVCLKLKETGSASSSRTSCATGTGDWATLPGALLRRARGRRRADVRRAPDATRSRVTRSRSTT